MRGPTHITGNRLDRVMTDVPDIVEVVIITPLGTSDHCFAGVWFVLNSLCQSTCQKYCLYEASYQPGQRPQRSQELYMEYHFEAS